MVRNADTSAISRMRRARHGPIPRQVSSSSFTRIVSVSASLLRIMIAAAKRLSAFGIDAIRRLIAARSLLMRLAISIASRRCCSDLSGGASVVVIVLAPRRLRDGDYGATLPS